MSEKFGEKIEKRNLPMESLVVAIRDKDIEQRKRYLEKIYKGLEEEGIMWPKELIGGSVTIPDKKIYKIDYVPGDILLTYATVIHELGHLRQCDMDERFELEESLKNDKYPEYWLEKEHDAWRRGWNRIKKYSPKVLEYLEEKFLGYKETAQMEKFDKFKNFYQNAGDSIIKAQKLLDETQKFAGNNEKAGRLLAKSIKKDPALKYFFEKQDELRVGENVNEEEIEKFIKDIFGYVSKETYKKKKIKK